MKECLICHEKTDNLVKHIKKVHRIYCKEYYDRFYKDENSSVCKRCRRKTQYISIDGGYHDLCISCRRELKSKLKVDWWIYRKNYSKEEAEKEISRIQKKNNEKRVAKNTVQYWIDSGYNEEKAVKKREEYVKRTNPNHFDCWLEKCGDRKEAEEKFKEYIENRDEIVSDANKDGKGFVPIKENFIKLYGYNEGIKAWNKSNRKKGKILRPEYWMSLGYTEQEAKEIISERQVNFSKEKCIEKYGEEEGLRIWKERQRKWQETLNSKSEEEIKRINRCKRENSNYSSPVSKGENVLLENIKKHIPDVKHQLRLEYLKNQCHSFYYDICYGSKIIEFNGDYWHCNPLQYSSDFYHERLKKTAREKWEEDETKIKNAEEKGYEVMVIWESELKNDFEGTINKCLNFIGMEETNYD